MAIRAFGETRSQQTVFFFNRWMPIIGRPDFVGTSFQALQVMDGAMAFVDTLFVKPRSLKLAIHIAGEYEISIGNEPAEPLQERTTGGAAARSPVAAVTGPLPQDAPLVAIDGTLWVERSGHVGTRATWDVFDAAGRNVRRTTLPAGRRLVALGRASAYLVATDDDGLERLERYALR